MDEMALTGSVNRRSFLRRSVATSVATCLSQNTAFGRVANQTIDHVDTYVMRYPMTGYFKFFSGPHGSQGRAAVIVKMTATDGTIGWGQSVPIARWSYETLETAAIVIRDYFAPAPVGQNPLDMKDLAGQWFDRSRYFAGCDPRTVWRLRIETASGA